MSEYAEATLPYRVEASDLVRFLVARARGRDPSQIKATLDLSQKSFEGTIAAASALNFLDAGSGDLTDLGRRFALASSDDARREFVLEGMLAYGPYELLLEAVFERREPITTLGWIETWWNTQGQGSSASNRSEASSTFARLAAYAGLGNYVQGRRGHPSRIEWADSARTRVSQRSSHAEPHVKPDSEPSHNVPPPPGPATRDARTTPIGEIISLNLPLGPGRVVEIRAPAHVTATEKARIKKLIDILIPSDTNEQTSETGDPVSPEGQK